MLKFERTYGAVWQTFLLLAYSLVAVVVLHWATGGLGKALFPFNPWPGGIVTFFPYLYLWSTGFVLWMLLWTWHLMPIVVLYYGVMLMRQEKQKKKQVLSSYFEKEITRLASQLGRTWKTGMGFGRRELYHFLKAAEVAKLTGVSDREIDLWMQLGMRKYAFSTEANLYDQKFLLKYSDDGNMAMYLSGEPCPVH